MPEGCLAMGSNVLLLIVRQILHPAYYVDRYIGCGNRLTVS
jgi:hypothetical protein